MTSSPNSNELTVISEFKPSYKGFDPSVARKLAELIQHAYKHIAGTSLDELKETYEIFPLGTPEVPFGFVASEISSENVFIVFRGTIKFIEWFKNINIQLVTYKDSKRKNDNIWEKVEITGEIAEGVIQKNQSLTVINTKDDKDFGYVTAGFRGIYITLRQQMLDALEKLPQDSQIYLTGHSLGGALATLAVPDILKNTNFQEPQNIKLYTFASPRCGDRTFATSFEKTKVQHWRIANTEDFVTMIPFPTGNVFQPAPPETPPELDVSLLGKLRYGLGIGGVTGVDRNPNPIFGFFKAMYDRNKRRMPGYVHTGTPIYFTIHADALEKHHNLHEVYMLGIGQDKLEL
jgi:hypothetical protein